MLKTIATNLAVKFKEFPYFGRARFWILYWAYKLTGWHIRHKEWDFVLEYLPRIIKEQEPICVLDVGCAKNLIYFELIHRGYTYSGVDLVLSDWQKKRNGFEVNDITEFYLMPSTKFLYDFVTCISVLEHVGENGIGDKQWQRAALKNMIYSLKIGGRLLLTCPTKEFAVGHPWTGFNYMKLYRMLPFGSQIIEYTEKAGQVCIAVERTI